MRATVFISILLYSCVAAYGTEYGTYSTTGHTKALGIEISIDYPITWTPSLGLSPGVVHEFRGPKTTTRNAMYIVVPPSQPGKPTPQEFREAFELPGVQELIMPTAKHRKKEFIEGLDYPCVALDYDLEIPQIAPSVIQVRNYILLVETKQLQIQFYAIAPADTNIRVKREDMMMHIIRSIKKD